MSRKLIFVSLAVLIGLNFVHGQVRDTQVIGPVTVSDDASPGVTQATLGQVDPVVDEVEAYVKPPASQIRRKLSRMQYKVTQNAETEPPRANRYWNSRKEGIYECVVCGQDLFSSVTKFKSGTGWPSFYSPLSENQVGTKKDYYMFYPRTEVHCSRCKAHLGHVFNDGPPPTGRRYCMNSASMNLVEMKEPKEEPEVESEIEPEVEAVEVPKESEQIER